MPLPSVKMESENHTQNLVAFRGSKKIQMVKIIIFISVNKYTISFFRNKRRDFKNVESVAKFAASIGKTDLLIR